MDQTKQIEDLAERFIELEESGFDTDLEQVCRAYPELIEQVRSRVFEIRGDSVWGTPSDSIAAQSTIDHETTSDDLVTPPGADFDCPSIIGRYEIVSEIARGGMGAVLMAKDLEFDRPLAIKVTLAKHVDNEEARRRFLEEAKITGRLQHPGIPPVHELGFFANDRPYFAMKLIEGRTL